MKPWRFKIGRMLNDPEEGRCFYDKPFQHMVCVGSSGKGKTSLFQRLIHEAPGGVIVLDPTGDMVDKVSSDFIYVDQDNPISLNPLDRDYLDESQLANEFAEIIEVAVKTTSKDQWGSTVLMQEIFRNAIRVGIKDFKRMKDIFKYDTERRKLANETADYYWQHFDDQHRPGFFKDRDSIDSAKRISARLSLIVDDKNAFPFFRGKSQFFVKDIADNKLKYIFNLRGYDDFIVSLIGGTIANLIKTYYRKQAQVGGPPIFFICDEIQYFLTTHYTRFFVDCRRYSISINISLHTKFQLDDKIVKFIDDTVHTKIVLKDKFEADVHIGDSKQYRVRLYLPITIDNPLVIPKKQIPPMVSVNFLRDDWIPVQSVV